VTRTFTVSSAAASAAIVAVLPLAVATAATVPINKIALTGDVAPGTGRLTYWRPEARTVNGIGQPPVFQSFLRNGPTPVGGIGLWTGAPRQLVVQADDAAPAAGAGVTFQSFFTDAVTPGGYVVLDGTLTGPGVTADVNDRGLWTNASGPLTLLARTGANAPGIGGSVKFLAVGPSAANDLGATAFHAYLDGGGVNANNDTGIWHAPVRGCAGAGRPRRQRGARPGWRQLRRHRQPTPQRRRDDRVPRRPGRRVRDGVERRGGLRRRARRDHAAPPQG
jgi:hypothetical protein